MNTNSNQNHRSGTQQNASSGNQKLSTDQEVERDSSTIPGYELIRRIKQKQIQTGDNSENLLLERLGLTRQYWNSFCNGNRPITTLVSNRKRRKFLAQYLGCSQLEIRILAGDIEPEELITEESDALWLEMERMQGDSRFGMLAAHSQQEWEALPIRYRILIVTLYRTLTDTDMQKILANPPKETGIIEAL